MSYKRACIVEAGRGGHSAQGVVSLMAGFKGSRVKKGAFQESSLSLDTHMLFHWQNIIQLPYLQIPEGPTTHYSVSLVGNNTRMPGPSQNYNKAHKKHHHHQHRPPQPHTPLPTSTRTPPPLNLRNELLDTCNPGA